MRFFHGVRLIQKKFAVIIAAAGLMFVVGGTTAHAATYTVNTTADGDDGSCTNPYVDASNDCTFHEAIDAANANAGTDTVNFNISTANFADDGDGQFTITMSATLPTITGTVEINGTSMWDSTGTKTNRPGIRLLGTSAGSVSGITVQANSTEIKAITVDDFTLNGISVADDSVIVGTDCDGTDDDKERVVVINNSSNGIYITGDNAVIAGDYIGIHEDGVTAAGNGAGDYIGGVKIHNHGDGAIVGYSSTGCTADVQRNVISGNNSEGIYMSSVDNSRISGNYIGLNAAGTQAVANSYVGLWVDGVSTGIIIGTNGDGTNDSSEGNVISGNTGVGIQIYNSAAITPVSSTITARVSGNIVGLNAAGTAVIGNGASGILVRADGVIVGWCDTTLSATLCSNAGASNTQGNTIAGNTSENIRIGVGADYLYFYGNSVGTLSNGSSATNPGKGMIVNRATSYVTIGGSAAAQQNIIAYHTVGVYVFITTGIQTIGAEHHSIVNNNIHDNSEQGILCSETLEYATVTPYENTLSGNTISSNGLEGVLLNGCSWDVQSNTINSNGGYGLKVVGMERPDDPSTTGSVYSNPYDAPSPNNASNDLVSQPRAQNNSFTSNEDGAMYFLDTRPTNYSTVVADNTYSNNGSTTVLQAWRAAVELLNESSTPLTSGSETVTLTPADSSCSTYSGSAAADAGGSNAIWGPTGISYNNATTWFTVTEYFVNNGGTTVDCSPYTVQATGTYTEPTATTYDFNGSNDDTTSVGGLPNGIATSSLYRYQLAEVSTNTDADSDGLSNTTEITLGTDPRSDDSDDDGIGDSTETDNGSAIDTDSDGTIDALDTDSDGDTRSDVSEGAGDNDADSTPNYRDTTNVAPSTPTNNSPAFGAADVSRTPTLTASTFSDPEGDGHGKSKWKIYTTQVGCTNRSISGVVDTTSTTMLTSYVVPSGSLDYNTTYWWTVAYVDNFATEATSSYSACTSFTTLEEPDTADDNTNDNTNDDTTDDTDGTIAAPTFGGQLPDLTINEDAGATWAFDLDDYFTSADALTYSVSMSSSSAVNVNISDGGVTITPWDNWYGTVTMSFTATDSTEQTATSNSITVTVNGINDVPTTVSGGFSPSNGDVTSATSIAVSWFDAWDAEDSADTLSYEIVFGSGDNPFNATLYSATLTGGVTASYIPLTLENLRTYSYSIETIDSAGARSGWSAIQQFTVDQQLKPALSLTKTIKNIKSDEELRLDAIQEAINNAVPQAYAQRVSHIARTSSSAVLFTLTLLLTSAVVVVHSPHILLALGMKNSASPFTALAQRNVGGTYTMSYSQFTRRVHLMRQALIVCGIATILLLAISYVAEASEEEPVIHPGATAVVAITYTNTGTGPATGVVIDDTIPGHTVVKEDHATLRIGDTKEELRDADGISDNAMQFTIGSVAAGASGTLTYRVVASDQLEQESMEFAPAIATANELTDLVSSGSVSVPVETAKGTVSIKTRDQQPLEQVTMRVYAESITNEHLVAALTTDENGNATIEHVAAGAYLLAVETPATYNPVPPQTIALSYGTESSATIVVTRQGDETSDNATDATAERQNIPFENAVILNTLPSLTAAQTAWTVEQSQLMTSSLVDSLQNQTAPLQIESAEGVPLKREETPEGTVFIFEQQYGVRDLIRRWIQKQTQVVAKGSLVAQGTVAIPEGIPLPTDDAGGVVIRVSILPDIIVQSTQYDTTKNVWGVRIPADTLQPNVNHTAYGELSANGQSTGPVEIERFSVRESIGVPLSTVLMLLNWLVLVGLLVYVIGYVMLSSFRRRRATPAAPASIDSVKKNQ